MEWRKIREILEKEGMTETWELVIGELSRFSDCMVDFRSEFRNFHSEFRVVFLES